MNSNLFLLWASEKVRESKNMLEAKKSSDSDPAGRDREEAAELRAQAEDELRDARRARERARRGVRAVEAEAERRGKESIAPPKEPLPSTVMGATSYLDYLNNLGVNAGFQSMSASGGRGQSHHYQRMQEAFKTVISNELNR